MLKIDGKRVLLCTCDGGVTIDGPRIGRCFGGETPDVFTQLCRREIDAFGAALAQGTPLLVACTQEAPLFFEYAADEARAAPVFVNLREQAGWSAEASEASPKMAALLAGAVMADDPRNGQTLHSDGATLVYACDEVGLDAAQRLASTRSVTCLMMPSKQAVLPPARRDFILLGGRIADANGHLGAFTLAVDGLTQASPSARDRLVFDLPIDDPVLTADVILDLSGGAALFGPSGQIEGYVRADPGSQAAVERALAETRGWVGDFVKPKPVVLDADRCVHARNGIVGCTRCLDVCPSKAISAAGDQVAISAAKCCATGACASACPTGAIRDTRMQSLAPRLTAMLKTYRDCGGRHPRVLFHTAPPGTGPISVLARLGAGLPADCLPYYLDAMGGLGLESLLRALALGADEVLLLCSKVRLDELAVVQRNAELAQGCLAALGLRPDRVAVLIEDDLQALGARLWQPPVAQTPVDAAPTRLDDGLIPVLRHLAAGLEAPVPLPVGVPVGAVLLDTSRCTLCFACAPVCQTAALVAERGQPSLSFREEDCVQCGLCRVTCPEDALRLAPRLAPSASERRVLKAEDLFACIRCGETFGMPRSSVEKILERLAGHPMFQEAGRLDLIKMCEKCRPAAQADLDRQKTMKP